MNPGAVRRGLFNLRSFDGQCGVRVDILETGKVRLRVRTPYGTRDTLCGTLEDMVLHAAMEPTLTSELYHALMWEMDLMTLRGE